MQNSQATFSVSVRSSISWIGYSHPLLKSIFRPKDPRCLFRFHGLSGLPHPINGFVFFWPTCDAHSTNQSSIAPTKPRTRIKCYPVRYIRLNRTIESSFFFGCLAHPWYHGRFVIYDIFVRLLCRACIKFTATAMKKKPGQVQVQVQYQSQSRRVWATFAWFSLQRARRNRRRTKI